MALAEPRLTPEEYLAIDRRAEQKSEYFAGRMFAMGGASRQHVDIVANVTRELGTQFKGRPCHVYPSDMRVKVSQTGLYTYPDASAVCEPAFEDAKGDTLLNPMVVFEVLSPSTEAYDRGDKAAHYRRCASVQEYVLISQDRVRVEHFARQRDGSWRLTEQTALTDLLELTSIACTLPLAEIYDKVDLPDASSLSH
ncbi:MAG: Uma2 family endonuclease [Candidatus Xenobia bacterium]